MIPFHQGKFGKDSLVLRTEVVDKDVGLQPEAPEGPCKKHRTESLDRSQQKG